MFSNIIQKWVDYCWFWQACGMFFLFCFYFYFSLVSCCWYVYWAFPLFLLIYNRLLAMFTVTSFKAGSITRDSTWLNFHYKYEILSNPFNSFFFFCKCDTFSYEICLWSLKGLHATVVELWQIKWYMAGFWLQVWNLAWFFYFIL